MIRSPLRRRPKDVQPRRDRSDEFASFEFPAPRPVVVARDLHRKAATVSVQKTAERVDQRIRDSARGEECTVRIVGACCRDTEHTIWSHAPFGAAGKGRGIKAIDLAGAYCCTACDAVVDGQAALPVGASRESVHLDWFMGHLRSLVILRQKGLA